jgi:hypothetical protein
MDKCAIYCRYYEAQRGGEIPVFRGGRQSGEGLGDILRGIFRFIAPIALRGFTTFAGHTLDAHQRGATLKDAAKSALTPTLNSVTSGIAEQFRGQQQQQTGSGVRRIRRHHQRYQHTTYHPYRKSADAPDVYKKAARKPRPIGKFAANNDDDTHYNF